MNPKTPTTAADFFLQISVVVTLYASAISFLAFMFTVIDTLLPDRQVYVYDPYSGGLRFAISTLIVVFPLFIYLSRRLRKAMVAMPEKRELWVRKWLTYFTLFISGAAVAVDVITLINSFLGGEITSHFILKVLAVLVVAGAIFWYYIADLKGKFFAQPNLSRTAALVTSVIVTIAVICGFFVIGSPASQRKLRDDNQRVSDLSNIQYQVLNYYQTSGVLPVSLVYLSDSIGGFVVPTDPATGAQYEYSTNPQSKLSFDICATFATASVDTKVKTGDVTYGRDAGMIMPAPASTYPYDITFGNVTWKHPVGRQCFTRTIDPAKYPVNKLVK